MIGKNGGNCNGIFMSFQNFSSLCLFFKTSKPRDHGSQRKQKQNQKQQQKRMALRVLTWQLTQVLSTLNKRGHLLKEITRLPCFQWNSAATNTSQVSFANWVVEHRGTPQVLRCWGLTCFYHKIQSQIASIEGLARETWTSQNLQKR